jgi:hypothetical protein
MKRKRHTPDEIIRKLREAEAQLGTGSKVADVCKRLGVSEVTFHRCARGTAGCGHRIRSGCVSSRRRMRG